MSDFGKELDAILASQRMQREALQRQKELTKANAAILAAERIRLHLPIVEQVKDDIATAHPKLPAAYRRTLWGGKGGLWFLLSHFSPVFDESTIDITHSYSTDSNNGTGTHSYTEQITIRKQLMTSIYLDDPTGTLMAIDGFVGVDWGKGVSFASKHKHLLGADMPAQATSKQIVPIDQIDPSIDRIHEQPVVLAYRDAIRDIITRS